MKCYSATVTLDGGEVVEVDYPADHPQPHQAALAAAAKKLGRAVNPAPRSIVHHRDGEPKDVPPEK